LDFEQEPDYEYLRGLFKQVMTKYNFVYDFEYDWSKKYAISTKVKFLLKIKIILKLIRLLNLFITPKLNKIIITTSHS
jgi:hypothetical protein